jgi:hypothetical protein
MNTNSHDDDTLKEILMEDEKEVAKSGHGKGCLPRILFLLILLLLTFLGFIFIQQYLLDLEAEAIVRAARTATAAEKSLIEMTAETPDFQQQLTIETTQTPLPSPTQDPALDRTATVAVQLTDVAIFQLTVTVEP